MPYSRPQYVGMTQYFTCNFSEELAPQYVATSDITSCVVVLLKNLDEHKQCSSFGMAHFNYANVYFDDVAETNVAKFIEDFLKNGGSLATASIQVLGGAINDTNNVREKIIAKIKKICGIKGHVDLVIKVPPSWQLDAKEDASETCDIETMTVACDTNGTYLRKIKFKKGVLVDTVLYPQESKILTDENCRNVVLVDGRFRDLQGITACFYSCLNQLLRLKKDNPSADYKKHVEMLKELAQMGRSDQYASAMTRSPVRTVSMPAQTSTESLAKDSTAKFDMS